MHLGKMKRMMWCAVVCTILMYKQTMATPVPPTDSPTKLPTLEPTLSPTSSRPTVSPSSRPTVSPSSRPTVSPSSRPTVSPSSRPTVSPSSRPTVSPSSRPTSSPIKQPTVSPSRSPTKFPTNTPTTSPTMRPTASPTLRPSVAPSISPTMRPTANPTRSPTNAPTTAPTRCQVSCGIGFFNVDWEAHKTNGVCLQRNDLNCQQCPGGTYIGVATAWETCSRCGSSEVYCPKGSSAPRPRPSSECTYRSDLQTNPQTSITLTGPAFPGSRMTVSEDVVRDSVGPCGAFTFTSSIDVSVVRPAVTFFDFTMQNNSPLPVRVSASSWVLPPWLRISQTTSLGSFTLQTGDDVTIPFVVRSSSIPESSIVYAEDASGDGTVASTFSFVETQIFPNLDVDARIKTVSISVLIESAVLQLLPQENEFVVEKLGVTEQTLTLYNIHPDDVAWMITRVQYTSKLTDPDALLIVDEAKENDEDEDGSSQPPVRRLTDKSSGGFDTVDETNGSLGSYQSYSSDLKVDHQVLTVTRNNEPRRLAQGDWLQIQPTSGTLSSAFRCTIDSNEVVSNTSAKFTEELSLLTNATDLAPGVHTATIFVSNGQREVLARVSMTVLPGSIVFSKSTWEFQDGVESIRLPAAVIRIVPRDLFGIETTTGVDALGIKDQFRVRWTLLEEGFTNSTSVTIKFEQFVQGNINQFAEFGEIFVRSTRTDNSFSASIEPPKVGSYAIEVTSVDGTKHLVNSPTLAFFDTEQCDINKFQVPTEGTGKGCVCIEGYGVDVESNGSDQVCVPCPVGKYSTNQGECVSCPIGQVQSQPGATACNNCPITSEPTIDQTGCQPCDPNEAVDDTSPERSCKPCRADQHVVNGVCVCRDASYTRFDGSCAPCPEGAYCSFAVASTIVAMEGYWRTEWDLLTFVPCTEGGTEACKGVPVGQASALTNNLTQLFEQRSIWKGNGLSSSLIEGNRSWTAFEQQSVLLYTQLGIYEGCAAGYTGPLCNECAAGFYPEVTDRGSCLPCETYVRTIGILTLTLLVGISALLYFIYRTIKAARQNGRRREIMIFKLVFSHLQIVSMAKDFPLRWPDWLVVVFDSFNVISSAGSSAIDMHCIAYYSNGLTNGYAATFFQTSLWYAIFPFMFCLISALFWGYIAPRWSLYRTRRRLSRRSSKAESVVLQTMDAVQEDEPLEESSMQQLDASQPQTDDPTGKQLPMTQASFRLPSPKGHYRAASCPVPNNYGNNVQPRLKQLRRDSSTSAEPLMKSLSEESISGRTLTNYEKFVVSNLVLLFVVQPWLTRVGLRFFSCSREIKGKTFLEASFSLECWTEEHLRMTWVGYVILVLYGIGIPLLTLFILYCIVLRGGICTSRSKTNGMSGLPGTDDTEDQIVQVLASQDKEERLERNRDTYGFIYNGYRPQCFFWETLIMARKTAFALIVVALGPVGVDIQTYAGLCVLVVAGALQLTYNPYDDALNLNEVEGASLAVTFATLMCGVFLFSSNTAGWFKVTSSVMVLLLNFFFLVAVAYNLRHEVRSSAQIVAKEIRATIQTAGKFYTIRRKSTKSRTQSAGDSDDSSGGELPVQSDSLVENTSDAAAAAVPVNAPKPPEQLRQQPYAAPGRRGTVLSLDGDDVGSRNSMSSFEDATSVTQPRSPYGPPRSPTWSKPLGSSENIEPVPRLSIGTEGSLPPPIPPRSPAAMKHGSSLGSFNDTVSDYCGDDVEVSAQHVKVIGDNRMNVFGTQGRRSRANSDAPSTPTRIAPRPGLDVHDTESQSVPSLTSDVTHANQSISRVAQRQETAHMIQSNRHEQHERRRRQSTTRRTRAGSHASHSSHASHVTNNAELLSAVEKFRHEAEMEQQANHPHNAANIALETLKALERRMQEDINASNDSDDDVEEDTVQISLQ